MAADPQALSTVSPEPLAETDYDAICAAVTATARGRWFLDEFAKRNRNSDTSQVLAAIARMEATVVGERTQQASREAHQEVRIELLEMARTIAQARAEVAESRPLPSQPGAAEPATSAVTPDVAAAAERLRQIAWTMRACGIELPASDQIGRIAETILSADALRGLGEQRAQKLTEALLYLEQRIDRMLDGHRAAASGADIEPAMDAAPATTNRDHGDPPLATAAVAMIAAAMRANAAQAAEAAPTPWPAAAGTIPEGTTSAASGIAEYPMDDDVVLTVTDSAIAPVAAASLATEPPAEIAEPAPIADSEPAADADTPAPQDERVELELEPLMPAAPPAAVDSAEAGFSGLEIEPLAVADEPPVEPQAAAVEEMPAAAAEETPEETPADTSLPATAAAQPDAAPDTPELGTTDAIAQQVDQDLDELADDTPDDAPGDAAAQPAAAPAREQAVYPQLVHTTAREDEPADFLLEEAPRKVPVSALVASAQTSRAQLSDTLAAIESELFGSTRPPAADAPSTPTETSAPGKAAPATDGPLAALMAASEEERIALFS